MQPLTTPSFSEVMAKELSPIQVAYSGTELPPTPPRTMAAASFIDLATTQSPASPEEGGSRTCAQASRNSKLSAAVRYKQPVLPLACRLASQSISTSCPFAV